jgi:hypothetical protein
MTAKPWDGSQPPDKIGRQVIVSANLLRITKASLQGEMQEKKLVVIPNYFRRA